MHKRKDATKSQTGGNLIAELRLMNCEFPFEKIYKIIKNTAKSSTDKSAPWISHGHILIPKSSESLTFSETVVWAFKFLSLHLVRPPLFGCSFPLEPVSSANPQTVNPNSLKIQQSHKQPSHEILSGSEFRNGRLPCPCPDDFGFYLHFQQTVLLKTITLISGRLGDAGIPHAAAARLRHKRRLTII
jgi:hypothetical protein